LGATPRFEEQISYPTTTMSLLGSKILLYPNPLMGQNVGGIKISRKRGLENLG